MENLVEKLTEKYSHEKAQLIDRHLLRFLAEQGVSTSGNVEQIKADLKKGGFELIQQVDRTLSQEVYTFKLCRVYESTQLVVPFPDLSHLTS
jgi:hypothetical protein